MYMIHMFEFTYFRSSHEKLHYQMFFDIETDNLQNSVKSSILVKLLYAYSSTKVSPSQAFYQKNYLEEHL